VIDKAAQASRVHKRPKPVTDGDRGRALPCSVSLHQRRKKGILKTSVLGNSRLETGPPNSTKNFQNTQNRPRFVGGSHEKEELHQVRR